MKCFVCSKWEICQWTNNIATIADIEYFLSKLRTKVLLLKKDFDIDLLFTFVDKIIESENVTTIQRVLSMLYTYADLFSGSTRQRFFLEYLLNKQFNTLAFFWEENIPSLFIQLLLFKGSIAKRCNIEMNMLTELENKLYSVQEPCDSLTPLQLDMFE